MKLEEASRASLASQLLRGLRPPMETVSDEEVLRRMREGEDDPGAMLSREDFLAGIDRRGN